MTLDERLWRSAEAEVARLRAALDTETEAADMYHDELKRCRVALFELDAEVERLRAALTEALDPNTEWTSTTWARLTAVRDGED